MPWRLEAGAAPMLAGVLAAAAADEVDESYLGGRVPAASRDEAPRAGCGTIVSSR